MAWLAMATSEVLIVGGFTVAPSGPRRHSPRSAKVEEQCIIIIIILFNRDRQTALHDNVTLSCFSFSLHLLSLVCSYVHRSSVQPTKLQNVFNKVHIGSVQYQLRQLHSSRPTIFAIRCFASTTATLSCTVLRTRSFGHMYRTSRRGTINHRRLSGPT